MHRTGSAGRACEGRVAPALEPHSSVSPSWRASQERPHAMRATLTPMLAIASSLLCSAWQGRATGRWEGGASESPVGWWAVQLVRARGWGRE